VRVIKEVSDRVLALAALVAGAPAFAAVAVAIWVGHGGPVLFRQTRVGKGGRAFTVLKFRTMVADAEQRLAGLAGANEHNGVCGELVDRGGSADLVEDLLSGAARLGDLLTGICWPVP
jgi:lipopolysaccharide/colanic/teichoic acid biosynthesis glycosyltransferase